ncbi:MAG: hypothetical protein IT435_08210 [Phycisphaerales bacterium]|nr:hypothetical protein [Phycisphaerales bacterium]
MGTLSLVWKLATGPIWLMWSGYKGLWWVFGDTHATPTAKPRSQVQPADGKADATVAGADGDQKSSFEVVDSRPEKLPVPKKALRGGFIGTLLCSAGMFIAGNGLAATQVMSPERAMAAWMWGTGMVAVVSIFAVRRIARLDRERRGFKHFFRCAGSKAAGACTWAAGQAAKGAAGAVNLGKRGVEEAAGLNNRHDVTGKVKAGVGGVMGAARKAWSSIGRAAPADVKTAA